MPVNEQVVDEITINKVNAIGGAPAHFGNLLVANTTSNQQRVDNAASAHQQAMQAIVQHTLTEAFGQRAGIDVSEAAGATPLAGVTDVLVQTLAQVLSKAAGNTPPQSNP
jgi:hypothetical protein